MDSSCPEDRMRKLASILSESLVNQLLNVQSYGLYAHRLDLAENQREVFHNLHRDMGRRDLEEPVEEYLTDLEARKLIFDKFMTLAHQVHRSYETQMTLFAVFMIAPIDILRSRVETLEMCHLNDPVAAKAQLIYWQDIVTAGMRAFANRENDPPTSSPQERPAKRRRLSHQSSSSESKTLEPPSPRPRTRGPRLDAKKAARLCKFRDGDVCPFTGMPTPVAAHIFPSVGSRRLSDITAMLDIFWGADAASRLSELATGEQNMLEDPRNLVSLNRQLHWFFNNGRMALKPLRETEYGAVTVQFHWLILGRSYPEGRVFNTCWDELHNRTGLNKSENQFPRRNHAHRPSGLPLETGQTFTFKGWGNGKLTPNFHLLQLSWDLRRVAAIAGVTRDGLGSERAADYGEWISYMYRDHSRDKYPDDDAEDYDDDEEDYGEEHYDEDEGYDEEHYDGEGGYVKEHYDEGYDGEGCSEDCCDEECCDEEGCNEESCNEECCDHYGQDLGNTEANPDSQEANEHFFVHEWVQDIQAESGNEGGDEDFLGDV